MRYIALCPRPAAERQARAWAVQDDTTLDALQGQSEKDLATFAARGGFETASRMFDSYGVSLSNILFAHLFSLSTHKSLDPAADSATQDLLMRAQGAKSSTQTKRRIARSSQLLVSNRQSVGAFAGLKVLSLEDLWTPRCGARPKDSVGMFRCAGPKLF